MMTSPGTTERRWAPIVAMTRWRAKLARTRSSKAVSRGVNPCGGGPAAALIVGLRRERSGRIDAELVATRSARAVVDRALDLGLELDVAAQEVVVLFAEGLGVAALAGLDAPCFGELVEALEKLLGVVERLQKWARAVGLDQVDG